MTGRLQLAFNVAKAERSGYAKRNTEENSEIGKAFLVSQVTDRARASVWDELQQKVERGSNPGPLNMAH